MQTSKELMLLFLSTLTTVALYAVMHGSEWHKSAACSEALLHVNVWSVVSDDSILDHVI